MAYFYFENQLLVGTEKKSLNLVELSNRHDHPIYVYDLDHMESRLNSLTQATSRLNKSCIHYAMKANSHPEVLGFFARKNIGVDTVSVGEIKRAQACGFANDKIIFSGVGKTKSEIRYAIRSQIKQINVESPAELLRIAEIASDLKLVCQVAFRMNPNVNPKTHPYITTGFRDNKFGMDESFIPELVRISKKHSDCLNLRGLTIHIGSQLTELPAIREALEKTVALYRDLQAQGFKLDRLDVGGGLGIQYQTADESSELKLISDYGQMLTDLCAPLKAEILMEPGRILVARAGLLIGQVQYIKETPYKKFVILNTGMHHLIRPALYGAQHRVLPLEIRDHSTETAIFDVVGPICESSDVLARDVRLSVKNDDHLAIADAGAYGFAMSSHYNLHESPREICVTQGQIVAENK